MTYIIIPMLQMRKFRHRVLKGWRDRVIQQGRSRAEHTVQDCRQLVLLPSLTAFHSESADLEIRGAFWIWEGKLSVSMDIVVNGLCIPAGKPLYRPHRIIVNFEWRFKAVVSGLTIFKLWHNKLEWKIKIDSMQVHKILVENI